MRAVAVIAVILFHLDHRILPGGFVGVDIFFVLSGFFITQLLYRDLASDSFSLLKFYDRRVRRLLPALFLMLGVVSFAAYLILMPSDLERFGRHLAGAALSVSNIVFWGEADYFAPDAETFPLLHTWSLAVEEQFYLFYPLMLLLIWKYFRERIKTILLATFVLSFLLAALTSYSAPAAAFYLAPARAWELAGGALLALGTFPVPRSYVSRQLAYLAGLALIAVSVVFIDESMAFPGFVALLPCAGTMLIIWAGLNSAETDVRGGVQNILTNRVAVWIGLISYSLYLWHWPIIVLTDYYFVQELNLVSKVMLLIPITLAAVISWAYVEQPFRQARRVWPTMKARYTYAGVGAGLFCVLGASAVSTQGYPTRLTQEQLVLVSAEQDFSPLRARCHRQLFQSAEAMPWCEFGPQDGAPVYMYSDSHGAELSYVLADRAEALGLRFTSLTASACPPVVGYDDHMQFGCRATNAATLERLKDEAQGTVILTAHFHKSSKLMANYWDGFQETLTSLKQAGHHLVILGPTQPNHDGSLPAILAQMLHQQGDAAQYAFAVDIDDMEQIEMNLREIADRMGATYISMIEPVCGQLDRCYGINDGAVIYFDDHHLSVSMAEKIVDDLLIAVLPTSE